MHGDTNEENRETNAMDEIKVKVLKFDREKERVSLGLKQKSRNPWDDSGRGP